MCCIDELEQLRDRALGTRRVLVFFQREHVRRSVSLAGSADITVGGKRSDRVEAKSAVELAYQVDESGCVRCNGDSIIATRVRADLQLIDKEVLKGGGLEGRASRREWTTT